MIPTTALLLIAILTALFTALTRALRRDEAISAPAPRPRPARAQPARPVMAKAPLEAIGRREAAPKATDLALLEWDAAMEKVAPRADALDGLRAKIRNRYIAARFPGLLRGSAELQEPEQVIKVARLYFEEEKFDRAQELLTLAIEQSPGEASLRLAQLEIAFLVRDGSLFTTLAAAFRAVHPDSAEWNDVARLGRAIAPQELLFGSNPDNRAHAHYGPWPDMPNWINASWDLTSEVLAADFHRAMANRTEKTGRAALRRVA